MPNRAIGLIHTGHGDRAEDEQAIRALVRERGYDFAGLLTITENTYMPTTLIMHTASSKGATVIVTPSLSHLNGAADAMSKVVTVDTPTGTLSRTS